MTFIAFSAPSKPELISQNESSIQVGYTPLPDDRREYANRAVAMNESDVMSYGTCESTSHSCVINDLSMERPYNVCMQACMLSDVSCGSLSEPLLVNPPSGSVLTSLL